ncbi:MAG TPA: zinc dependent phospholipase C family protein [Thermoanaerobaculia bacterium]|nr:zinc dependent phospholipase C family protein [Thermoanaerobaculia bacterium]
MLQRVSLALRFAALAAFVGSASPAVAWTPSTQVTIAREAAQLAPPDLARQIDKHRKAFEAGAVAPFQDTNPARHGKNADGSGELDKVILAEAQGAIDAIRQHRPFEEVVRRLGVVSHYMADANNPLAASSADAAEGRYFVDYLRYAETAEPRFPLVFYGVPSGLERRGLSPLLAETFRRGREVYPLVGMEYRRIGFASGIGRFDDRSTAFGVASVAFSHAVTDVVAAFRYIWITAGGADGRGNVVLDGQSRILRLPRAAR